MEKRKIVFIKTFLPLFIVFLLATAFFLSYNHYLLDRSLVNLKVSLDKLKKAENLEEVKKIKDILDDTFLMEVARGEIDATSLAKIEFTAQIIDKISEISQREDARYFLENMIKEREEKKNPLVRMFDHLAANIIPREREENIGIVKRQIEKLKKELSSYKGRELQEQYLNLAKLHMRLKDWKEASIHLNKIIKIEPETLVAQKANFYLGLIYKLNGEYQKAVDSFSKVKEKIPGELGNFSHYEQGDSLYRMGRVKEAIEVFTEIFKKDPHSELNQVSQFRAGYIQFYDLGREAEEALREKPKEIPESVTYAPSEEATVGEIKVDLKRTEKAYGVFQQIVDIVPESKFIPEIARIYREKGFQLLKEGYKHWERERFKSAENFFHLGKEQFELAIELNSKDGISHSGRALAFYFLGEQEEALRAAKKGKELAPSDPEVLSNLGFVYAGLGMLDEAIIEHLEALKIFPVSDALNYNLGTLYALRGNYSQAFIYLKKAIEINPKPPYPYNNLGYTLWREGRYKEAKEEFQKGLKAYPEYIKARYNLGVLFYNLGQLDRAQEEFERVKSAEPSYRKTSWYLDEIKKRLLPK